MADRSRWPGKNGKVKWFNGVMKVYLGYTGDLSHGIGWFCRMELYRESKYPEIGKIGLWNSKGECESFGFHKNRFTAFRMALRRAKS